MVLIKHSEVWFITGSQDLYGIDVIRQVEEHSLAIAAALNESAAKLVTVIHKPVLKSADEIFRLCIDAGNNENCIGLIAWMHTFSPAKMWIRGLSALQKPLLHLHTQFNRDIPWSAIDMDFMNLNQSAHGDREFGFMMTRLRMNRKTVTGHWRDPLVHKDISTWLRAALAWHDWQGARFVRFGDNMRNVAVTEGDKVEAEIKLGYSVNTHGIADLVKIIEAVDDGEVDQLCDEYAERYRIAPSLAKNGNQHKSLREAAKIEAGLRNFLTAGNYKGFTDTFEDLHGLAQLPGIAVQRLMAEGYGFAGEGDWKTAALVRAMKVMAMGLPGGNSFMEDYTYHFHPDQPLVLGSHMLEICPSIAAHQPECAVHQLSIGGKGDPVRLIFSAGEGPAINASVVDLGNRFRMVISDVLAVIPPHDLPALPVARVLWKPLPDLKTASTAWIIAGGGHHTCFSQNLNDEHLHDFAEIAGIECIHIGNHTTLRQLKNELRWNELYYQFNK